MERGLQILQEPAKGSKPSDAARLLAVGDSIGRAALGIADGSSTQFGLRPTSAPNIRVVIHEGEATRRAQQLENEFFEQNPTARRGPDILKVLDATIIDEHGRARKARDD